MTYDVEYLFICLVATWCDFHEQFVLIFAHFSIEFLVFLLRVLYIWGNGPVSDIISVCSLSYSLDSVLQRAEFFYISDVQLIVLFMDHAFGILKVITITKVI